MTAALRRRRGSEPLVEGEYPFTAENFEQIADALNGMAGIVLNEAKAALVYSRLAKRLRALGMASFDEYCDLLQDETAVDERRRMLTALTTNVTRFFREPHHFDDLRDRLIGPAIDGLRRGGRLRLWSAGCSTGQEPYSIALSILAVLPEAADLDIRILATDIDQDVIAKGAAGAYSAAEIEGVPDTDLRRWMERDASGNWCAGQAMRRLVTFKELNLMGEWPMKGPFQAIFCRNVVIYFDEPTQARVWSRFVPLLAPEGRLYVGHSERVQGSVSGVVSDGQTVYRRTGTGRR